MNVKFSKQIFFKIKISKGYRLISKDKELISKSLHKKKSANNIEMLSKIIAKLKDVLGVGRK